MFNLFHLPMPNSGYFYEFYSGGNPTTANTMVKSWQKPIGITWIRMLLIGAGGGGGPGTSVTAGGGGASGNYVTWQGPAAVVPNYLNIQCGTAGLGAVGGGSQTAGGSTIITWRGNTSNTGYTLLTASGGGFGSNGTGGTAAAVNTTTPFGVSGNYSSVAGQAGSFGAAILASTTTFLSGGAGGGASALNGFTATANYGYASTGGTANGTGGLQTGGGGIFCLQPLMVGTGGGGGAGVNNAASGGTGGRGGIGCGGGGGGVGTSGFSNGGNGGDGAVFIWCW